MASTLKLLLATLSLTALNQTSFAQSKPLIAQAEMNTEESAFVSDLNKYRTQHGEQSIEYGAYISADGKRYLWPTQFQADSNSKVATAPHLFFKRLYELTKGEPVVVELFAGFSAAEYDKNLFKDDLRDYTNMTISENKRKYGPKTHTVFISGATAEGIGLIYSPDIQGTDLLKTGIVSDQALAYEMKYGNQIAPGQDATLLVDSFRDVNDKKTWEVKTTAEGPSYNNSAHDLIDSKESKFNLFEGGDIGMKEALEWLENRSSASFRKRTFSLNLVLGYQAAKQAKDKGFRASSQLAQVLMRFPELIPTNVSVNIFTAGEIKKGPMSLTEFKKTKTAKHLLERSSESFQKYVQTEKDKLEANKTRYPDWYKKNQVTLDLQARLLDAWVKNDSIAASVLRESQARNQKSLNHWTQIASNTDNKLHPDDLADRNSGIAQQSADLLATKMKVLDSILGQLDTSKTFAPKCPALFN